MAEMELYHVHIKNESDTKWRENNIIKVDENFNSVMNQRQQNFSQTMIVEFGDETSAINYYQYLIQYINRIKDTKIIKKEELEELKNMLQVGYDLTFNADIFKRETALEACRKDHFSDIPSRLHSVYLCDQDGLDYWKNIISSGGNDEIEVFKVLADGKIFKTNEQLLPCPIFDYKDTYSASFSYWKPKFKDVPNWTNEYLVQGKIKVLEKINK